MIPSRTLCQFHMIALRTNLSDEDLLASTTLRAALDRGIVELEIDV